MTVCRQLGYSKWKEKTLTVVEIGMINKISDVISNYMRVNMRSISVESKEGLFEGNLKILVTGNKILEGLVRKLEHINGVTKVSQTRNMKDEG